MVLWMAVEVCVLQCTCVHVHDEESLGILQRTCENRQPPGIELWASDFSCQCSTT